MHMVVPTSTKIKNWRAIFIENQSPNRKMLIFLTVIGGLCAGSEIDSGVTIEGRWWWIDFLVNRFQSISRLNSGIVRIFGLSEWNFNQNSSDCTGWLLLNGPHLALCWLKISDGRGKVLRSFSEENSESWLV